MTPAFIARFCLFILFLIAPAVAQQAQLRVLILEGEGALNNTLGRANRDVVVEIQGADTRPVAGAMVTFTLPATGASGTFANGERTTSVTSNAEGRATATGIRPNNVTGPLQIRVAATFRDQTATAVVQQTNVAVAVAEPPKPTPPTTTSQNTPSQSTPQPAPKKGMSKAAKVLLILAIGGGVAAGAGVALSRSGSTRSGAGVGTPPPIIITPGVPSVGGPQ